MEGPYLNEEDEEMRTLMTYGQENGGHDDDDDDHNDIRTLIDREVAGARLYDQELAILVNNNWYQESRTRAIPDILRTGRKFRFRIRTIYRAVTYLDRFLARRIIAYGDFWALSVSALACLSLSARMDERRDNVQQLSTRNSLGMHNFNVKDIRQMELLVINELNWNMICVCVTPFEFRNFFISRFCRDVSRRYITRMRIAEIIMSVPRDVSLMNHRPSVIAAAATLLALNRYLTLREVEIEINALPINGYFQAENVYYCYFRLLVLNEHI